MQIDIDYETAGASVKAVEGRELGVCDVAEAEILGVVELEGVGASLGFDEGKLEEPAQASQVSAQFKMTSSRRQYLAFLTWVISDC